MRLFLFFLLLLLPGFAQENPEGKLLENLGKYYRLVGMDERATWLTHEIKAGRVRFGEFPATESDTAAAVEMRTGIITINNNLLGDNTFRGLVDLGNTLAHERVHQNQSYWGWAAQTYKQDLGMGNAYEVAGWAESIRVARQATLKLRARLSQAKSQRERERLGEMLKQAAGSWQNLLADWKAASKTYGNFASREFVDEHGLSISLTEMAKESAGIYAKALDATVTSKAMNRTYTGKYRGSLGGGASGTMGFDVRADQTITGRIKGLYRSNPFEGGMTGTVNVDGLIRGEVSGSLQVGKTAYRFRGDFSGSMSGSNASGQWKAGADKFWPAGNWSVQRL